MLEIHFYSICDKRKHTCRLEMGEGGVDIDESHAVDDFYFGKLYFLVHLNLQVFFEQFILKRC